MIKKTIKQKSKQNINDHREFTVTYKHISTEDAKVRTDRICRIISDALRRNRMVNMHSIICYCFNYSETDIEQDVIKNKGVSTILEKIKASKQLGSCRCHETNPSGK